MSQDSHLLFLFLLSVCCSDVTATGSPTVHISRLSPTHFYTVNHGELVQLSCVSTNLPTGYFLSWYKALTFPVTIARNGTSLNSRYTVSVADLSSTTRNETLHFHASGEDNEFYSCGIVNNIAVNYALLNVSLYLSVLYDPAGSYPICFPNGPFTGQEGTKINMSCTTEIGNPPVRFSEAIATWNYSVFGHIQRRSNQLTVSAADDGRMFQCRITSIPPNYDVDRSCTIGPITVISSYTTTSSVPSTLRRTHQPYYTVTSQHPSTSNPTSTASAQPAADMSGRTSTSIRFTDELTTVITTGQPSPCTSQASRLPWIAAFIITLILLIASIIINSFFIVNLRHRKSLPEKGTNEPRVEPYMELQPTSDENREYIDPGVTDPPSTQHTYYQANVAEDDYEQPSSNNTPTYLEVV